MGGGALTCALAGSFGATIIMMSSARDEHDTVPPPAGEDDAYSAATKVGAMPAELMARLRAEGLLPEDFAGEQPPPPPPPPAASVMQRVAPPPPRPRSPFDDLPELSSDPPPPARVSSVPARAATSGAAPPFAGHDPAATAGVTSRPPAPLETPISFVSQPPASSHGGPVVEEAAPLSARSAEQVRSFSQRSKLRTTALLVAVIVALVAFAFVMALLSQRR